jgi:hypothetical protein
MFYLRTVTVRGVSDGDASPVDIVTLPVANDEGDVISSPVGCETWMHPGTTLGGKMGKTYGIEFEVHCL